MWGRRKENNKKDRTQQGIWPAWAWIPSKDWPETKLEEGLRYLLLAVPGQALTKFNRHPPKTISRTAADRVKFCTSAAPKLNWDLDNVSMCVWNLHLSHHFSFCLFLTWVNIWKIHFPEWLFKENDLKLEAKGTVYNFVCF